jgi:hypothetical protein
MKVDYPLLVRGNNLQQQISNILICLVAYLVFHLFITQHVSNLVILGGILVLDMALPLIAGILFSPRFGLLIGLVGTGTIWLVSLPLEPTFDHSLLLCIILPLGIAGYLSGVLARRQSVFISSLPIVLAFYLTGVCFPSELFTSSVALGLLSETMIDILLINLVCLTYMWWISLERTPIHWRKDFGQFRYITLAIVASVLTLTSSITIQGSSGEITSHHLVRAGYEDNRHHALTPGEGRSQVCRTVSW